MNKKQNDLISVIVPVYNIGKALIDRCVNSIVQQTYHDLEIILVDDGSTDESGEICDMWLHMDERIKVIHRENGGLSVARNIGTQNAKGRYLLYVDSDDWIESNMVEVLYQALIDTNSELSMCGAFLTDGEKKVPLAWFEKNCILTNEIAYMELINDTTVRSHAWNKMYKAEIIKDILFPEGKLYEDIRMMHLVFRKCNQIAVVKEHLYNYYRRANSIVLSPKLYNKLEFSAAYGDRYRYVKKYTPQYSDKVLSQIASSISISMVQNNFSKNELNIYKSEICKIRNFLKKREVKKAVCKYCSYKEIIYFFIGRWLLNRGNILYRVVKKIMINHTEWE